MESKKLNINLENLKKYKLKIDITENNCNKLVKKSRKVLHSLSNTLNKSDLFEIIYKKII